MKLPLVLLALSLALVFASCRKADSEKTVILKPVTGKIMCPERIAIRQNLVRPIQGWDVYIDPSNHPGIVDFYTNDPSESELILHEDGGLTLDSPASDIWLTCSYSDTRIVLARPVGVIKKGCRNLRGDTVGVLCE